MHNYYYRNLNIGFMKKGEVQGPTRLRVCVGVKHTFTKWGKMQWMKPKDSTMHSHFGNYICAKIANV